MATIAKVKRGYYELYFIQQAIAVTEADQKLLGEIRDVANARYKAGKASQQDLLRAELEISNVENELIRLRQRLKSAQARLARVLHIAPQTKVRALERVSPEHVPRDLDWLQRQAVAARPELHAQLAALERDQRAVELARLDYMPDVTLGATWIDVASAGISPVANGQDSFLLTAGINLPIYRKRLDSSVRSAEAKAVSTARTYDSLRDATLEEVMDLFAQAQSQQDLLTLFREDILPKARQRLKPEMFVRAIVRSKIAAGGRVLDSSLAGKWISPMHPEIVKDEPGNCDVCGMPLVRAETLGYVTAEPSDVAKPLVIPVTAALLTGTRAIVYIQVPDAEEPTYEGREIVLGPRAGDYYLVKAGLEEGQLVVTNGSFKLDSALQISAKPSMMTPEGGGGGGGHNHGGESKPSKGGEPMQMAGDSGMSLSPQLKVQLQQTIESVEKIGDAIESAELGRIREAFGQLGQRVAAVDGEQLSGDMKAQLQEFAMLLRNDSVEGKEITDLQNADRIYLVTKRHAERLQKMFGLSQTVHSMEEQSLEVPPEFRSQLSQLIPAYLLIGQALSTDDGDSAARAVTGLHQVVDAINPQSLEGHTSERWNVERNSLSTIAARLSKANDLASLRTAFALLSDELLALQRTFGFPNSDRLFELHCPMAFNGRGASWIQSDDAVRNPYYGASMLKCADRVGPLGVRSEASDD